LHIHHAFIKESDFPVMADIVQTTCYLEAACIKVIGLCGKIRVLWFLESLLAEPLFAKASQTPEMVIKKLPYLFSDLTLLENKMC
jgi:hypothetical protein